MNPDARVNLPTSAEGVVHSHPIIKAHAPAMEPSIAPVSAQGELPLNVRLCPVLWGPTAYREVPDVRIPVRPVFMFRGGHVHALLASVNPA